MNLTVSYLKYIHIFLYSRHISLGSLTISPASVASVVHYQKEFKDLGDLTGAMTISHAAFFLCTVLLLFSHAVLSLVAVRAQSQLFSCVRGIAQK